MHVRALPVGGYPVLSGYTVQYVTPERELQIHIRAAARIVTHPFLFLQNPSSTVPRLD
jgi:hypothetical protein